MLYRPKQISAPILRAVADFYFGSDKMLRLSRLRRHGPNLSKVVVVAVIIATLISVLMCRLIIKVFYEERYIETFTINIHLYRLIAL